MLKTASFFVFFLLSTNLSFRHFVSMTGPLVEEQKPKMIVVWANCGLLLGIVFSLNIVWKRAANNKTYKTLENELIELCSLP